MLLILGQASGPVAYCYLNCIVLLAGVNNFKGSNGWQQAGRTAVYEVYSFFLASSNAFMYWFIVFTQL